MFADRIVVPTDFSEAASPALEVAARFAPRLGAELELLHVIEDLPPLVLGPIEGAAADLTPFLDRARQTCANRLRERAAVASEQLGRTVEPHIVEGHPAEAICARAAELPHALICMTTHGRTGLSATLVGSVAERVVRLSTCPVLTLKQPPERDPRCLLFATDLTAGSLEELPRVHLLARQLEAELVVLHVIDHSLLHSIAELAEPADLEIQVDREAPDRLRKQVEAEIRARCGNRVPARVLVRLGTPYQEIVEAVRAAAADLVVLGTHGRTGLRRAFLGSVAERVVRLAPQPVLVLPIHG